MRKGPPSWAVRSAACQDGGIARCRQRNSAGGLPESPGGARSEVPSGNCSLPREVWHAVQGFRGSYSAEMARSAGASGRQAIPSGSIRARLSHTWNIPPLKPFARERFERGRDFGRMRVRVQAWSRLRCLVYLLGSPSLPATGSCWHAPHGSTFKGRYVGSWLATFPVQLLGTSLWCLGEARAHGETLWQR